MEQSSAGAEGAAQHQPSAFFGFVDNGANGFERLPRRVFLAVHRPLYRYGKGADNPIVCTMAEACCDDIKGCRIVKNNVEVYTIASYESSPAFAIVAGYASSSVVECLGKVLSIAWVGLVGRLSGVAISLYRQVLNGVVVVGG